MQRDFVNNQLIHDGDAPVDLQEADSATAFSATAITLTEADEEGGPFTAVDSADLIVPEGGSEQEGAFAVGYRGNKRFIQAGAGTFIQTTHLNRVPANFEVES